MSARESDRENQVSMFDFADVAAAKNLAGFDSARQKAQLMIDQGEHAGFPRSLVHATRFFGIHRHRLFTKNRLATIERSQSYLAMRNHWRDDANQIDVVASDERAPITFNVGNAQLARDFFRMFAVPAGNRDDF